MKLSVALIAGALFFLPGLVLAQTASPSPAPTAAAGPASATTAPIDKPVITIPPGWTASPSLVKMGGFTLVGMWYAPQSSRKGDNINLGYSPNPDGADLDAAVPQVRSALLHVLGAGNVSDHAEKLCNGTVDGWLFHGNMTMGTMRFTIDEAILASRHEIFGATYTRMSDHPADPVALKSYRQSLRHYRIITRTR